jgi:hypothetical protein
MVVATVVVVEDLATGAPPVPFRKGFQGQGGALGAKPFGDSLRGGRQGALALVAVGRHQLVEAGVEGRRTSRRGACFICRQSPAGMRQRPTWALSSSSQIASAPSRGSGLQPTDFRSARCSGCSPRPRPPKLLPRWLARPSRSITATPRRCRASSRSVLPLPVRPPAVGSARVAQTGLAPSGGRH